MRVVRELNGQLVWESGAHIAIDDLKLETVESKEWLSQRRECSTPEKITRWRDCRLWKEEETEFGKSGVARV